MIDKCKSLRLWTRQLIRSEKEYVEMYKELADNRPGGIGLADWRCSRKYKKTLSERSEPIRQKIKQAKIMIGELTK